MFVGAMTAIVTPMRDGVVDWKPFEALIEAQIAGGIDGLVPCGTTGESATLTHEEHAEVLRFVVKTVNKRVKVLAGAGSNSTQEAISLAKAARAAGADGLMLITPYYNKPTQEGLYQHFRAIVEAVPLATVVYNVPSRTGVDMLPDTIARLCELPQIVGVKEATGQVTRTQDIIRKVGDRVAVLSGEDAINYPLYCVGARGCISVVSNVAPQLVAGVWDAYAAGDYRQAQKLHYQSLPLADALFLESNPIPVKTALHLMGRIGPDMRAPLCPMSGTNRDKLRAVLSAQGLL